MQGRGGMGRGGTVVSTFASRQCVLDSIPGSGVIWFYMWVGSAAGVFPGTLVFPPSSNPTFLNSNSIRNPVKQRRSISFFLYYSNLFASYQVPFPRVIQRNRDCSVQWSQTWGCSSRTICNNQASFQLVHTTWKTSKSKLNKPVQ